MSKQVNRLNHIALNTFEGNVMFLSDASIALGYALKAPEEGTLTPDNYQAITQRLASTLTKLPIGTRIQKLDIYFESSPNFTFLDPIDPKNAQFSPDYFKLHKQNYLNNKLLLKYESYIYFIFGGNLSHRFTSVYSRGKPNVLQGIQEFQPRLKKAQELMQDVIIDFPLPYRIRPLSHTENEGVFYRYFNLDFDNPDAPHTLYNGMYIPDKGGLNCAGQVVKMLNMKQQTDAPAYAIKDGFGICGGVSAPFFTPISHYLRFNHIVVSILEIKDTEEILKNRERGLIWLGVITGALYKSREEKKAYRALGALQAFEDKTQGQQLVGFDFSVIIWDHDEARLQRKIHHTRNALNALEIVTKQDDYGTGYRFFNLGPGCARPLTSLKHMPALCAISQLLSTSPNTGDKEGIVLSNRFGEPIYYNPFKYELNNQHAFIFGPSGSGKSFFNGKMIRDRYDLGHSLIIIDSGGTYRSLFKALGGKYIEYLPEKPLALNPFLLKPEAGKYNPDHDKISFLGDFIGKIWREDVVKHPLSSTERTLLRKYLIAYYEALTPQEVPSLKGFYLFFQDLAKTPEIQEHRKEGLFNPQELLVNLESFAIGEYASQFNASELAHLEDERLICFELAGVRNNQKLYPLVLQILFDFAFNLIKNKPKTIKFIDVEEGWSMLNDFSMETIEGFFRKGRKQNVSVRMITQDFAEIEASPIASALKNNASTFILLYNELAPSRKAISAWLGLSELDEEKYNSLRVERGFREVFIKEMNNSFIRMVDVPLEEHALLTSNPEERHEIDRLIESKRRLGNLAIPDGIADWVNSIKKLNQIT